jgi:hypothetical protein
MTFASLEKLIRKEARRVIENLERSFSLYEEDEETPAAETPAAETPAAETPAAETPAAETPAAEAPAGEALPGFGTPAPAAGATPGSTTTDKPNEEKTGLKTVGSLGKIEVEKIENKTNNLYPETRETLLQYDYEDIIDMYDLNVGNKKTNFTKLFKRAEMIAISKHSLVSKNELDKQTVLALQHYYVNSIRINNIIRFSEPSVTKQEIDKQIKLGKPKAGNKREKSYNSAMNAFTIYELDYAFSEEPQRLESSILTYRSVKNEELLKLFIESGQWVDESFVTTSLNPFICEGTGKKRMPLFEFFIPLGTSILTLPCNSNDYCHETEVTLPRKCRYTIQGFNDTRNIYKILVEQIYG